MSLRLHVLWQWHRIKQMMYQKIRRQVLVGETRKEKCEYLGKHHQGIRKKTSRTTWSKLRINYLTQLINNKKMFLYNVRQMIHLQLFLEFTML